MSDESSPSEGLLRSLLGFAWEKKWWWITPIVLVLVLLVLLILLTQDSAEVPFIYRLF